MVNVELYKNSLALFNFYLFKTLKEWNFFEFFVNRLTTTFYTHEIIYNNRDLINKANDPTIMDDLWEIRKEALAESFKKLDPSMKNYYLYNLKTILEATERKTVKNFGLFEKLAFSNRNDYETFVKEIDCPSCKIFFPMALRLIEILDTKHDKQTILCPNCNTQL